MNLKSWAQKGQMAPPVSPARAPVARRGPAPEPHQPARVTVTPRAGFVPHPAPAPRTVEICKHDPNGDPYSRMLDRVPDLAPFAPTSSDSNLMRIIWDEAAQLKGQA